MSEGDRQTDRQTDRVTETDRDRQTETQHKIDKTIKNKRRTNYFFVEIRTE